MDNQDKASMGAGGAWQFASPEIAETLQMQFQALLQEQAEFLDETRKTMVAWTKRRQEAIQSNYRTFAAMGGCTDPAALNAAYSEWLAASMNRIFEDIEEVRKEALRAAEMGQRSMTAVLRAGENPPDGRESTPAAGAPVPRRLAAE